MMKAIVSRPHDAKNCGPMSVACPGWTPIDFAAFAAAKRTEAPALAIGGADTGTAPAPLIVTPTRRKRRETA